MRALPTLLIACIAGLSLLAPAPAPAAEPVTSVADLDLSRYAGQWYEIAHLPVSFQRQCAGDITATYALRADGRIGVRNACRTHAGKPAVAEGVARTVEGHPGRLQVRFVPDWLAWVPLVWADYWVIALDPDYQWAMVGDPGRDYLWILARDKQLPADLRERLLGQAKAQEIDTDRLIWVNQTRDDG